MDDQEIISRILTDIGKEEGRQGWEKLFSLSQEIKIEAKKTIVEPDKKDANVYIIKEGLARLTHLNKEGEEVTIAFATAGTCFLSPMSYVRNLPTFYHAIAVTECVLAVVHSSTLEKLMLEDAVFATSVFKLCMLQLMAFELKHQALGSEASKNFNRLRKKALYTRLNQLYIYHPDFLNEVSDKILASYLGVHPIHFSPIKKALLEEDRKSDQTKK